MAKEFETAARGLLPRIRDIQRKMPTLPAFRPAPSRKPSRVRFVEEQCPNWWQMRGQVGDDPEFKAVLEPIGKRLDAMEPFSSAIGKWIVFPELGEGVRYESGLDLAWAIAATYFAAAGASRWNHRVFHDVWDGFMEFVDSRVESVDHVVYAPILVSGVERRLSLEKDLRIQRFSSLHVARIATLDPQLAGVTFRHRLTLWPLTFLVLTMQLKKEVQAHDDLSSNGHLFRPALVSRINDETALFRALLSEQVTIPTYAVIRFSYPPRMGGGSLGELPWRVPDGSLIPLNPQELRNYRRLRAAFLRAEGKKGWERVMASIRRFAVAWDNEFRADILADLVAAMEELLVRSDQEVSYKLRVRAAFLLGKTRSQRLQVANDIRDAYSYRSKIFHGGYVFDNLMDYPAAKRLKRAKGKHGNPFHDFNEVVRLTAAMAAYYRRAAVFFIRRGQYEYDWAATGL
ncbi:MAG: hypothetical protein ACREV9_13715 [Burkholderiales bacterium]